MAAPHDAAAPRAIVKRWRRRCADEKTTADELLDLAVAALVGDDGGDASALRRRGAGDAAAARLLRAAARKLGLGGGAGYLRSVAWAVADLDPFRAAALRLRCHGLPSLPAYARRRVARDEAAAAARRVAAFPLAPGDDDAGHEALLRAAEAGDAALARRALEANLNG